MFRERYKQAYNQIKGDRTQIAKILTKANEPKQTKKRYMPFRFGSLAAAVLVLCVSLYAYPQFKDIQNAEVTVPRQTEPIVAGETRLQAGIQPKTQENLQNGSKSVTQSVQTENPAVQEQTVKEFDFQNGNSVAENNDVAVAAYGSEDVVVYTGEAEDTDAIAVYEHTPAVMVVGGGGGGSSSGARSATLMLGKSVRTTENGGYAEITVYAENSYLENLFNQEEKQRFGNVEAVVKGSDEGRTVIAKSTEGWVEIYAENVLNAELTQILAEVVQE